MKTPVASNATGKFLGLTPLRWLPALLMVGLGSVEGYTPIEAIQAHRKAGLRFPSHQAVLPESPAAGAPDTLVETLDQAWDPEAEQWVDAARIRYDYANSRLVRDLAETFQEDGWMNDSQSVYTYDAQGKLTEHRVERWAGSWLIDNRLQFFYDGDGRTARTVVQAFVSDGWINLSQTVVTYGANGDDSLVLNQRWEAGAWADESRVLRTLGPARTLHLTTQSWDPGARTWVNSKRSVYTYAMNGYLDHIVDQVWEVSAWANAMMLDYQVRAPGQLVDVTGREWVNGAWENAFYAKATYQGDRMMEILYQGWSDGAWVNSFRSKNVYAVPSAVQGRPESFAGIRRLPGTAAEARFEIPLAAEAFRADVFTARGEWAGQPAVRAAGTRAILSWGAKGSGAYVLRITGAGKRLSVPFGF